MRSPSSLRAVSRMTGVGTPARRNPCSTDRPSRPGSMMSSMIASKGSCRPRSKPALPSLQWVTSRPRAARPAQTKSAIFCSSSTSRMFMARQRARRRAYLRGGGPAGALPSQGGRAGRGSSASGRSGLKPASAIAASSALLRRMPASRKERLMAFASSAVSAAGLYADSTALTLTSCSALSVARSLSRGLVSCRRVRRSSVLCDSSHRRQRAGDHASCETHKLLHGLCCANALLLMV